MNFNQAEQQLIQMLQKLYDSPEAQAIANMAMQHISGKGKSDRRMMHQQEMSAAQIDSWQQISGQLMQNQPVQYVLGTAWFYGMELQVNEAVLIPRPETEELVAWVLEQKQHREIVSLIDIGTGSGCIPIAIKKHWPNATVYGLDVSEKALEIAAQNASLQQVAVHWMQADMLNENAWPDMLFDIIVSNPPYIPQNESAVLHKNVTDWEPHLALFVPQNDPLLFYRKIAEFARLRLHPNGLLYFECHQDYVAAVVEMLTEQGFEAMQKQDMFGNDRMVQAVLPTSAAG